MTTELDNACESLLICHDVAKKACHSSKTLEEKKHFSKMCNHFNNARRHLLMFHFCYEDALKKVRETK